MKNLNLNLTVFLLLVFPLLFGCGSGLQITPAVSDELVIVHYSNPYNVTIEAVADEIVRMGLGISNSGLLDASTYQIMVVESQRMAIGNSTTSAEPITVGTAEILFRLNRQNNVEMKITYDHVDRRGGNQESKIATGEFTRQLLRRLEKRLTPVSGEKPTWN